MTVKEIIINYLKGNGYDGLCNYDCGCGFDDFAPCGNIQDNCKPAYKCKKDCSQCNDDDMPQTIDGCYFEDKRE
jgi:hypothetical protein